MTESNGEAPMSVLPEPEVGIRTKYVSFGQCGHFMTNLSPYVTRLYAHFLRYDRCQLF